jgi:hypothetical protein
MFHSLCTPAFLYLGFGLAHVLLTIFKLNYMQGLKYFLFTILGTTVLNYICEKQLNYISWLLILVPFLLMGGSVLKDNLNAMFEDRKTNRMKEMHRNSDIVLYHDHGEDIGKYKHGVGIRKQDTKPGEAIEEKRNYNYQLDKQDTQYNGTNPMRFIRDQRLVSY